MDLDLVKATAAALATTLATTSVVSASEWLRARNAEKLGQTQLDTAGRQLAVLSSWANLQAQLNPGSDPSAWRAVIEADLDSAVAAVRNTQKTAHRDGLRVTPRRLADLILLTDLRKGFLGKAVRLIYWCCLAIWMLMLGVAIADRNDPSSGSGVVGKISLTLVVLLIFALPAMLFRWLTRMAARPRRVFPPHAMRSTLTPVGLQSGRPGGSGHVDLQLGTGP